MIDDIKYKLNFNNSEKPSGNPQASVLIAILNYGKFNKIVKHIKPDIIIHLAAQSTVDFIRQKKTYIDNNVKVTKNVISSVNENNIKHFIFSSGIDLIYEFFNLERKTKNNIISKTVKFFGKNSMVNDMFTKIADRGVIL